MIHVSLFFMIDYNSNHSDYRKSISHPYGRSIVVALVGMKMIYTHNVLGM